MTDAALTRLRDHLRRRRFPGRERMGAVTGQRPAVQTLFSLALQSHRQFQGGRGSGYDIACSTYGGAGLFCGGPSPTWQTLQPKHNLHFRLWNAPHAVSTKRAISTWQSWCQTHTDAWSHHLNQSQALIKRLAIAKNDHVFTNTLSESAHLGRQLGQQIGVWNTENECTASASCIKALGAGNELYAIDCPADHPQRVSVSHEGLQWT